MGLKCLFGHKWQKEEGKCKAKCARCGKVQTEHEWKNYRCVVCKEKAPKPALRSLGKETRDRNTYEYYVGSSAEEARLFLSYCNVTQPLYYIQVETPEGVWGMDKEGLYLINLLAFQSNLSLAQCKGRVSSIGYSLSVQMAALGKADNFICGVACGSCGHEWKDGVSFGGKVVVRCPACKTYNSIDTSGNAKIVADGTMQLTVTL